MGALRLVLGDQLDPGLSALDAWAPGDVVLMAEVAAEATYVPHHPKKIAFVLSAMRHHAAALAAAGFAVDHVRLDDPGNSGSLRGEVARAVRRHGAHRVIATEPGEWRLAADMAGWAERLGVPVEVRPDRRFLCSQEEFARWAEGRRQFRMEHFYRTMRRRTGLLMTPTGEPEGGTWNFDADNRKPLPRDAAAPEPLRFAPDRETWAVLALVSRRFGSHFGDAEPFWFAVTRGDAERVFAHFLATALPRFGDHQDAMRAGAPTLFHSVCSLYLNVGLLDPLAMCRAVEAEWRAGRAPINAAEGFIRQIIGWREYMRGVYWLGMPDYAASNALEAEGRLPALYWTGDTDLRCLAECIGQTRREAYAHHIQRLMVTGNFALLLGVEPRAVEEWYLAVYADAFEWVELPNTHGMALFADGGRLASKPYAASGRYIDRMSDYCGACRYDPGRAEGEGACPFNFLYWDFLARQRARLAGNPRMAMPYRNLDRLAPGRLATMRRQAADFRRRLGVEP
ncbi:cryptochrome/photolyase family protein [Stella sp.]|uniref:cryptochrome/photolyase family protein n=1 Tax=Stella sp. TaxID=2912054 RepID=UPI0035B3E82C